ncbi:MAG: CCA tRNA nucleotidyltransferase [Pseudoruegeria sp.]
MTVLNECWIEQPRSQAIFAVLKAAGHQAYFVGGCVRNALLGATVNDLDIATDARPDQVMRLFSDADFKTIPTGYDHGTVTVLSGDTPFEITTFRRDIQTDGRHAVVAYSTDLKEDAQRRDFTMNALYASADGEIIDPLDGLSDVKAGYVRFINDPSERIREDYLRILRFFRFTAWYGSPSLGVDAEGLSACAKLQDGLAELSKERVTSELLKLLTALDPAPCVATMAQSGVLSKVLEMSDPKALPLLIHNESVLGLAPDAIRRLSAMGLLVSKQALRLSNKQSKYLDTLRKNIQSDTPLAELAYRFGAGFAKDIVVLRAAYFEHPIAGDVEAIIESGANAVCPLTAQEFMPEFQGKALGERLKTSEQIWIDSGFLMSREALLQALDEN